MNKVYCIIHCFTHKKIGIKPFLQDGLCVEELINMRGGGAYTWIKTTVKEKEGLSAGEGLIGREIVCSPVTFEFSG